MNNSNDLEITPPGIEEISGRAVFWVLVLTLLVMIFGFSLPYSINLAERMSTEGIPDEATLAEWINDLLLNPPASIKLMLMITQAALILPAWLYLRRKKYATFIHLRIRSVPSQLFPYAILIGLCIAVVGDELARLMDMIVPIPAEQLEAIRIALSIRSVFDVMTIGLTVLIIAPFVEEAVFRGFTQRWFERKRGVTSGVLAASAIFAFYHSNLYLLIPILLMATILGAIAWRTESIIPSVIVHGTNNGLALIAANINEGHDPEWYITGTHVAPWWIILSLAGLFYGLRKLFILSEEFGLGGHGPSGDSGTRVDLTV
ncbi:MAG: CPBP family intramembrane metalloprotease [Candidatus Electryonea clarkiae]|nr:CPBP family intramembrane metalloprotease [Candidatus Electryonea clarkiae]MDP8286374.1 CPBP family intramembrane metalloprotease [Candidatus Electryonea clarkiae]